MLPIRKSGIHSQDMIDSFVRVLQELDHLLFSDEPIITQGGACYDLTVVAISTMLVQYWQTGQIDRYDVSGPDMINYALKREYQENLSEMLRHLHRWNPQLVPEHIIIQMFPGTVARVGHLHGHISQQVMARKAHALQTHNKLSEDQRTQLLEAAKDDEHLWPTEIDPKREPYFSQHDLLTCNYPLVVDEFWKDIPLASMRDHLTRAKGILRLRK